MGRGPRGTESCAELTVETRKVAAMAARQRVVRRRQLKWTPHDRLEVMEPSIRTLTESGKQSSDALLGLDPNEPGRRSGDC
jgi:hypothetical protein